MAKSLVVAALVATVALCYTVVTTSAHDKLYVEGYVYCDPCRVAFQTPLCSPIAGNKVFLTCTSRLNDTVTFTTSGVTNDKGIYSLAVTGDHEDDICEVELGKSIHNHCYVPFHTTNKARVLLTRNFGAVTPVRTVSALGFMTPFSHRGCAHALLDMGFLPHDAHMSYA